MYKQEPIRLETNSKVAVIGGGPAGSFFALYLLRFAEERCITPEITIYQERDFDKLGPKGCKGCAGILSISLLRNLKELGLTIPETIIQSKIDHYAVHSPYNSISISNPEKETQIVSVYRGGGPRVSQHDDPISFDGWLLRQTQERGVTVVNQTVSRIYLEKGTGLEVNGKEREYDLVVLAAGINAKPIPITGLDYVPPETRRMTQDEIYVGTTQVKSLLGNTAHVFLIPHSGFVFGTLVPKGPFITVSVLNRDEHHSSISDFLKHDLVRSFLPEDYQRACGCQPQALVSPARNYYADRFVSIGDAAVSRLYKDGTGSSSLVAREAAHIVVDYGIARQDFKRHYQPIYNNMKSDNRWGRLLFSINDRTKNSRVFLLSQQRLIGGEQENTTAKQPFSKAAWGMFTGSYSYRQIANMALSLTSIIKLTVTLFVEILSQLFHRRVTIPRKLHVGDRKILILGSGFGGTYALRHLAAALNRRENVETTMVSDENFFLFSPLLHEVAMGRIETRHVAYPIRRLHWRDRFTFAMAEVKKIDLDGKQVVTTAGNFSFDYLVLALGNFVDTSELDVVGENVFTLKTLNDARQIRNHIIGVFERASIEKNLKRRRQLLTFVTAGAGYTGLQVVTELRDFIYKSLVKYYKTVDVRDIRIILIEAEHKIAAGLHTKLGSYAMEQLQRMGIEVRVRARVTRAWEDHVEIDDSEIVPASTLIWLTGVKANPRIADLDVEKDSVGRVLVNEQMEVPGFPGVYAVGDCAHFEDLKSGQPIPPRAHTGVRQARIAAHNILADIRGTDKKPYRYSNPVEMVSLGASKAMFRFRGLRLYGILARLVWLGVYSLIVTGTYNRIRIIMDWLLSLIFGRDTSFIKLMR